mmetsp:Transcript_52402/g.149515  ORF Transcript_52402/g.149515 Transcript_52402/m.149515 type:complete len:115 (+) Transcript_52402:107-451(+)
MGAVANAPVHQKKTHRTMYPVWWTLKTCCLVTKCWTQKYFQNDARRKFGISNAPWRVPPEMNSSGLMFLSKGAIAERAMREDAIPERAMRERTNAIAATWQRCYPGCLVCLAVP